MLSGVRILDFGDTRQYAVAKKVPMNRTLRLGYILASSHSGSTLLAMLLGAQPGACTVGELKATNLGDPERYPCSCKTLLRECSFWRKVNEKMRERGEDFCIFDAQTHFGGECNRYVKRLFRPLHHGWVLEKIRDSLLGISPSWRSHSARVQRRNVALVESVMDISGAAVVIDSSKSDLRAKHLMRNPDLDVRLIRLIRDGRAVSLTYIDPFNYAGAADPEIMKKTAPKTPPRKLMPMAKAARMWRRSNEAAEELLARANPSRVIRLQYEEFCREPEVFLKRIVGFLDLDSDRIQMDFRSVEQHVIGNFMRVDSSSLIELDERWRSVLTKDELADFDREAGNLNRRYGYE